jgi:predicted N-formylglutamate amidohydrolase
VTSGYTVASREDDPIHTVRTIARLAQILIELRNEYVSNPRPEILSQIEQRLDDLLEQREILRQKAAHSQSNE